MQRAVSFVRDGLCKLSMGKANHSLIGKTHQAIMKHMPIRHFHNPQKRALNPSLDASDTRPSAGIVVSS